MESIETVAVEKFHKNLEYFKNSHPDIIKMLDVLSMAFDKGDMKPRYDLEYVDSYFDVKELSSGNFLYAKNSSELSKEFTKMVNVSKNSYSYEGMPVYHSHSVEDIHSDKAKGFEGIYPIMDYALENTNAADNMRTVNKFIFIGVALGQHIIDIDAKIHAKEYLIIEDDLELFRLSLFTISYFELGKNTTLSFSIADDAKLFSQRMNTFLNDSFLHNRYLKYAHFPTHSTDKLRQIQNALLSQGFLSFPYKAELSKILRPLEYINDGYRVLNLSQAIQNELFDSKPVLLLTAGPSFNKNFQWLKDNHERFIIIAVSATLKTLYENNIVPTIVTHIDGYSASMAHYEGFPIKEFLKDTIIILGPFSDGIIKNFFNKENVFYYEENTEYIEGFSGPVMPCVGSFSLLMSLIIGVKELYLLGLDLALDQKTGATHVEDHTYSEKLDMLDKDSVKDTMSLRENLVVVRGNFEHRVYTNGVFKYSIDELQSQIPKIKQVHQNIYNLNDGAYFESTLAMNIADVGVSDFELIDKVSIRQELKKTLEQNSINGLDDNDMASCKKRLEYSKEIKKKIEKYATSVSKTNEEKFLYDLLGLVSEILKIRDREAVNIILVYYSYFKYVLPIVFDLFNTQGLKNKKQHVKRLSAMIEKELMDIEGIYSKTLSDFLSGNCRDERETYNNFMLSLYDEVDADKIKNLYTKDSIGFLAVEETLSDKGFIAYIKELLIRFPKTTFKAFYFTKKEKELFERLFYKEVDRIEILIPKNISEILENIEIFLFNKSLVDLNLYLFNYIKGVLEDFAENVFTVIYSKDLKNLKAVDIEMPQNYFILDYLDDFNLTEDDVKLAQNKSFPLMYNKTISSITGKTYKIPKEKTLFDLKMFDDIAFVLKYTEFKLFQFTLRQKQKEYIGKNK